jgi:hypothetical protein
MDMLPFWRISDAPQIADITLGNIQILKQEAPKNRKHHNGMQIRWSSSRGSSAANRADASVSHSRQEVAMKVALLITGSGPLVIVTSHASFIDPALIEKLRATGIEKFIAYEVPLAMAQQRYGGHFQVAMQDLHESDDLRVLDSTVSEHFASFG